MIFLDEELREALEKRAKKNMLTLPDQIEDILRRSTLNQKLKKSPPEDKMDDKLVASILYPALLGGVGGLTRGVVGLLKALSLRRKILWGYYAITVGVALIIGVFTGLIFNFDYRLSLSAVS